MAQSRRRGIVETPTGNKAKGLASRRDILTAAGASIIAAAPAAATAQSEPEEAQLGAGAEVIVIGGGFCGVTAARELARNGHKVTILEARNRLGGRTFTTDFAGKKVDVGGTWIHWFQPHVWAEIRRYNLPIAETRGAVANDIIYLDYEGNRREVTAAEIGLELDASFTKLFEPAYEIFQRPAEPFENDAWVKADKYSIKDKLSSGEFSDEMRIFLDAYWTTFGHSPIEDVSWVGGMQLFALSGFSLTMMNDATARYKIVGGTQALLNSIADESDATVKLSTPVRSVRQSGNRVEVMTEFDEKFTADAVIVAAPMNVLKDIEFSPKLPKNKRKAFAETHAGQGVKVHIILDKEYPVLSGFAPGGSAPFSFVLWEGAQNGKTHFVAFGPSSELLDVNDQDAVQEAIRAFIPGAGVVESFGYEWNVDPYSKGTWFVSKPGQMSKHIAAFQEPHGRIHFANADFASGWRGTIDGAIERGLATASDVRRQL